MNELMYLLVQLGTSLVISIIILIVISKPLKALLSSLCDIKETTSFWIIYTRIMLVMFPLLLVLLVTTANFRVSYIQNIRLALIASVTGIIIGLMIIGSKLMRERKGKG